VIDERSNQIKDLMTDRESYSSVFYVMNQTPLKYLERLAMLLMNFG